MARSKIRSEIWEGEDIPTRARVILDTGSALKTSNASSYAVTVFDLTAGGTSTPSTSVYYTSTSTTSTGIYDTYRTSGWVQDTTGYNVEYILTPSNYTPQGGHTYRIVIDITTGSYGHIFIVHDVNVRSHMAA